MLLFFRAAAAATLLAVTFAAAPTVLAQDVLATPAIKKAKPAKAAGTASAASKDRRPGELEGWDSGVKAPLKRASNRPADVISEKRSADGGLPLPEPPASKSDLGDAPVGFNSSGNMGSSFKF